MVVLGGESVSYERGIPVVTSGSCHANVVHIRQSKPDYGLGLQVTVLEEF